MHIESNDLSLTAEEENENVEEKENYGKMCSHGTVLSDSSDPRAGLWSAATGMRCCRF